ncbi:DEAD/DEAH box helicase [Nocardia asteroides]|uniref:DEAD/DEAH box helicase n=1 Tax=Nocardia asteroides TaxID=1824 RepID=UPI003666DF55
MTKSRSDRKQQAIRLVLDAGPRTTAELVAQLAERGVRIDSTELFLLCNEFGLATFDAATNTWAVPGTVRLAPTRPERREADRQVGLRRQPGIDISSRVELRKMRELLLDDETPDTPTEYPIHPSWPAIAAQVSAALRDELSTVTRQRTQQEIPLVAGELVERAPTRLIVRYEIQSSDNVREGLTATLVPAEHSGAAEPVEAEVLSQFGAEITLKLPADNVFRQTARLRCDLSWLVHRQIQTYADFRADAAPGFCTEAALATISAAGLLDTVPPVDPGIAVGLNDRQACAVAHGLQPRVTWLWGPPGTGKTTTLAALLAELLDSGKTVLLAAPTNAAVDVALSALLARRPNFRNGEIARIGVTDNTALVGLPTPVVLDEIAAVAGERAARRLVEIQAELSELRDRLKVATEAKSPDRSALTRKIADHTEFQRELNALLGDVRDQVIRKAKLVACTTHQVMLKGLHSKNFDTVIIDEASMVSSSMAMLVAGAGNGHTVIAGDFRQLSPIVQADTPGSREWLGRSAFEKSGIAEAVRRGRPPANLIALNQQHRMRRQIGDAIGIAFYPEVDLRTASSVHTRSVRTVPTHQPQVVIVDTGGLAALVARRGGTSSRYNLANAQLAANVLHVPLTSATNPGSVGLISPFVPQARLLQALTSGLQPAAVASTVHRFQGGETDIVLYDAVESTGSRFSPHTWFTETHMGSEGARLLNVAMSRAREQAILLADMSYLRTICPAGTPVRRFLSHMSEYAELRPWPTVADSNGPTRRDQDLTQVLDDIAAATSTVDIFTAATDGPLTRQISEAIAMLPDTVKVSIWYRADDPTSMRCVEDPLRHHHTMLHPLRPVYESCIVADAVVWSATGPILGSRSGTLLRTDHAGLADALRRQLLRRTVGGAPGTGEYAVRCGCGSLRVREEISGGPRKGVHSVCRSCGD